MKNIVFLITIILLSTSFSYSQGHIHNRATIIDNKGNIFKVTNVRVTYAMGSDIFHIPAKKGGVNIQLDFNKITKVERLSDRYFPDQGYESRVFLKTGKTDVLKINNLNLAANSDYGVIRFKYLDIKSIEME